MSKRPRLLLLPGLISDRIVWRATIDLLSPMMPVAVGDLTSQDSITAMAEDMLARHDGPLHVAGHSMGGRVALEMLRLAPDRVLRLALLNTGINPKKEGEEEKRQAMIDFAHAHGMTALAARWLPPMLAPGREQDPAIMALLTAMVERSTPEIHERQMRALLARPDGREAAAAITCPLLLVVGRQDAWSPVAQHEEIAAAATGTRAKLVVVEDAGHFAPVEQPGAVADALAAWAL